MSNTPVKEFYGLHRVKDQQVILPQMAQCLDNDFTQLRPSELLIDVNILNVDSASFKQLKDEAGGDEKLMRQLILGIVEKRGKLQNPVTGSGGMLLGVVKHKGKDCPFPVMEGDQICTLVSLTLTPLKIEKIKKIHFDRDQVEIQGEAVLFASGICALVPTDFSLGSALALLDVCGAPAQAGKLAKQLMAGFSENPRIGILGAGKSGFLCCAAIQHEMDQIKAGHEITLFDYDPNTIKAYEGLGFSFDFQQMDATKPESALKYLEHHRPFDIVINVTNVPNCEMNSILLTKDKGMLYLFSMATQFTKAALGAEGVGKDISILIGNGYTEGHDSYTFDLVRAFPQLKKFYEAKYG